MKKSIFTALIVLLTGMAAQADDAKNLSTEPMVTEIEVISDEELMAISDSSDWWQNPAGSTWINVRCPRNSTCYPPAGFKFRHFNVDYKGSDCRKYKNYYSKNMIKTDNECRAMGRVFIVPASACKGNQRFCI